MSYEDTLAWGARQYHDVLDELAQVGLEAEFTQTGGMCAALQVMLDGGYYLLLTDRDDPLSWSRAEHRGWFIGLYPPSRTGDHDRPLRYIEDDDGSCENASTLAIRLLRGEARD